MPLDHFAADPGRISQPDYLYIYINSLDERWQALWSGPLYMAMEVASALYSPIEPEDHIRAEVVSETVMQFRSLLLRAYPKAPSSAEGRYSAVVDAMRCVLNAVVRHPERNFVEEWITVALRPVRRFAMGALLPDICTALIAYHRGLWSPHLSRPQLYVIETALTTTLTALPPDEMRMFWAYLECQDALARGAMMLGLNYMSVVHATPHLLFGLEWTLHHATRTLIVDRLEQIAEPDAIPTLTRLRRTTAFTDWTLSRHIARAIRVIEFQNSGNSQRTLLRPSLAPVDSPGSLLRPAGKSSQETMDHDTLVRSIEITDKIEEE